MSLRHLRILIADASPNILRLLAEVLRGAEIEKLHYAFNGREALSLCAEYAPDIIITTSRLPEVSGLEITRLIRAGWKTVRRDTGVIVMSDTATKGFLEAAAKSGADEMLVRPFTGEAVIERVKAIAARKREFIDAAVYVGPCRRRRAREDYAGPMRRFVDPCDDMPGAPLWEKASHREAVRKCVQKISECMTGLSSNDRQKLRAIFAAVKETEAVADGSRDEALGQAARSLGRYIISVGANGVIDEETVRTHIDAMHSLSVLKGAQQEERLRLVEGLSRIVDKRLGRKLDDSALLI